MSCYVPFFFLCPTNETAMRLSCSSLVQFIFGFLFFFVIAFIRNSQNIRGLVDTLEVQVTFRSNMTSEVPPGAIVYPAADRNKPHILECLKKYIALKSGEPQTLLEIGAGTGQHTAHFAPHFPYVTFVPTELETRLIKSIDAYRNHLKLSNVKKAAALDVTHPAESWLTDTLAKSSIDYVYSANMVHISPEACTKGLFEGASYVLRPGGYLFMYGPFAVDGTITPESNRKFDKSLRQQNSEWGLRDITRKLKPLADTLGLILSNTHDLPANNKFLVWLKKG